MTLDDYSSEQLLAEIAKRKANQPPIQKKADPSAFCLALSTMLKEMVDEAVENGHWDENNDNYITSKVIELLYEGKQFHEWMRKL